MPIAGSEPVGETLNAEIAEDSQRTQADSFQSSLRDCSVCPLSTALKRGAILERSSGAVFCRVLFQPHARDEFSRTH
jgi:hypothetical protein